MTSSAARDSAGGGVYVGGRHFGGFAELDVTVAAGAQTGRLVNPYAGPQFIWQARASLPQARCLIFVEAVQRAGVNRQARV